MTLTSKQSYTVQILRGLAIIAVVFIHNTPSGMTQVFLRPFLNFAVGMFLLLSGMLSNAEKWKPSKRIVKVIIPYAIWSFVYVMIHTFRTPSQIPLVFITQLFTGRAEAMLYYVFVYCELTLLIPLIDKMARSKFKLLGFIISPLEIIVMRSLPQIFGYKMPSFVGVVMGISCVGWFVYFYLGYLIGNGLLEIKISTPKLTSALVIALLLQMAEGYWYYSMGSKECGTQMKVTVILTNCILFVLAYRLVDKEKCPQIKSLHVLGDCSFGVYFSHFALMYALNNIPNYTDHVFFPIKAIIVLLLSLCLVLIGRKILGKFGKYFAF